MPPRSGRAASPLSRSEHQVDSSPSYLTALRELENPVSSDVLHIADTLTTSSEDDIIAENLRFLRSPAEDPQEEWRAENAREQHARERQRTVLEHRTEDRERRERLERVISRLRRQEHPPAYGDRTPSENLLYGWAPTNESRDEAELRLLLNELRQQQPNININPEILRTLGRSQLEAERQSQNRAYHSSRLSTLAHSSHSSESSLRATAIAQSVRRHPRFSDRTRLYMQRSLAERESAQRPGSSEAAELRELRDRFSPRSPGVSVREPSRYEHNRRNWLAEQQQTASSDPLSGADRSRMTGRDLRTRIDSYRRSFLENPSQATQTAPPPSLIPDLEKTIEYMSRLRSSSCYEDSLRSALETGFVNQSFFGDTHDDFLLNLSDIPVPAETSWLRPGAVLSGSQHATSMSAAINAVHMAGSPISIENRPRNGLPPIPQYYTPADPWGTRDPHVPPIAPRRAPELSPAPNSHQDRWPVKVTIHAVDYTEMSLSATMEAYNVPAQPPIVLSPNTVNPQAIAARQLAAGHGGRTSSITTYLEGEILDFKTHGFLTESFNSDPKNDATYWRKLLPFAGIDDHELVRRLTSKKALRQICEEYVFMRWKERCFVKGTGSSTYPSSAANTSSTAQSATYASWTPHQQTSTATATAPGATSHVWHDNEYAAEDSCGLTISGFYYVCLRRSDGVVEGLYHDPQSSPYQHLKLESVRQGSWPKYEFR